MDEDGAMAPEEEFWNPAANAAIILGVIGGGLSLLPFIGLIGLPFGALAIPFGIAGRKAARTQHDFGKGRSIAGIVLGSLAVVIGALYLLLPVLNAEA
jgi:hypothetical protein